MHRWLVALPLSAISLGLVPAHADVITPARDSVATISFSDPAFGDARLVINATQTVAPGSSGPKSVLFDAAPSLESYALSSSGAVGVTLNAFTPPSSFDLAVTASGAGSWAIAERFQASDDPFGPGPLYRYADYNDLFVPFLNNRLPALELTLFIGGLVDVGGSFGVGFTIPGDWSTTSGLASTTHQYFLANLDEEWLIDTAFVFDQVADVTRFHATNLGYEGEASEHPSPFLDVYFFGSVAEPADWAMFASLGAIGFTFRRRRQKTSRHFAGKCWPRVCSHACQTSTIQASRPNSSWFNELRKGRTSH